MTPQDLVTQLTPIADACLDAVASEDADPNVVMASVVLATLLGGLEGRQSALDALALHAGLICAHELAKTGELRNG